MKRDIRLIALDLDGTTLNSEKTITEHTRRTIEKAIEAGIIVMPSTGRPLTGLPECILRIPGIRYALTSNGGAVVDMQTREVVYSDFLDETIARGLLVTALKMDAMVDLYIDGKCIVERKGYERLLSEYRNIPAWNKAYIRKSRVPVDDLFQYLNTSASGIEKMLLTFDDMQLREEALEWLKKTDDIYVSNGLSFNIEINSLTATKGNSLLKFGEKNGINRDQIMACGDATNDYTMIERAGFSVAMGNACREIRDIADFITLTNDEDGVAYAIEKFVL